MPSSTPHSALQTYNQKRDFGITSEPPGKASRSKKDQLMFCVQKHDATALHYDFRLEWEGVLWSWAVPKGPSFYPGDKRLAVRTEDHPVSYGDFEGIIPARQYGAGPVMLWDIGEWEPLDKDPGKAIQKGKLNFRLKGEKLEGDWTLARMRGKDKRENWLLIKNMDEQATDSSDSKFLERTDYSVKSGRAFPEIAAGENDGTDQREGKTASTDFGTLIRKYKSPQLATLVDSPPGSDKWCHEVKYDGYRILVFYNQGKVRIQTRNGHDWTDKFPVLKKAFKNIESGPFVIDGEAVILDSDGLSDFKTLQNSLSDSDAPMRAYFFDLLYWDGTDYTAQPLQDRRAALAKLAKRFPGDPLFLSEAISGEAEKIVNKACELGLEGIVSKRLDATYSQGRTKSWLKSKCGKRQEFIICGFEPASGQPRAIGSLHLGYYEGKSLLHAGKVGTGFNARSATELYQRLKKLQRDNPPFSRKPSGNHKSTVWVKPELLCEVQFATWTKTGKVRHASFQGLRQDKQPEKVVREAPGPKGTEKKGTGADKRSGGHSGSPAKARKTRGGKSDTASVCGVTISNPEREIFPDAKLTKLDLASFYAEMAKYLMPGIENRPVTVVRCPRGIVRDCFYQRSRGKGMGEHIHPVTIKHDSKSHEYMFVRNITGLIELVQMGGIEFHPWGVRNDNTEKPDRIVFDLDPDEGLSFETVKLAARDVQSRLEELDLRCMLKCTGGKGLHIVVPIRRLHSWDTVKDFARAFAQQRVKEVPEAYTSNMAKKQRKGKIFIDYLRNDFAATAVMDYSVRARPGAPVAVPISWNDLDDLTGADAYSIADVLKRKRQAAALLRVMKNTDQNLSKAHLKEFNVI